MSGNHPPGTGPRPSCAPPARPNPSPETLSVQVRVFNHLRRLGRPATFLELHHAALDASKELLDAAILDLTARGLLIREETPSPVNPLLAPPIVRWRVFGEGDPILPDSAWAWVDDCRLWLNQSGEGGADQ